MIRNSTKYVTTKDRKTICHDLKEMYNAVSLQSAQSAFEKLKETWGSSNPLAVRVWENNIEHEQVYQLFEFPQEIRKVIYTTNAVESYNSQLRKVSNGKGAFPNDQAVMKLFYLRTIDIVKKWTRNMHNWSQILNQLVILYEVRITKYIH